MIQHKRGGLLYAPAREFYNGQFVLLPQSMADTQAFLDLVLLHPEVLLENAQISVLNGTVEEGLASKAASRLRRLGFHVIEIGNYETETGNDVATTFLELAPTAKIPESKNFLESFFNTSVVRTSDKIPPERHD
ncbi:LytR C-terminal domain-containing protein [uncultured Hyphomonas sp.]|uniref:LytR C-terminal domain-containing protein n=1 Tax=uncultured Hyphomonas sp. TaxID=225298 RepID=UPI002AABD2E2|nr:LytR C-terminal domain-containing protein [uncultured Hyphomonas sp.]